ncbi:hypothetical protein HU200_035224 [Digitaria exilis]|uniref:Uncharacterized protein n=1 Tax=Digitaria exilis TaxID=1010633 RepID=A0A835BI17_9POAL|nr:hypothetical protein HU200_035224 [Digitaria exilis]
MARELKLLGMLVSPFAIQYVEEDLFNKSDHLLKLNLVHKKSEVIVQYVDELSETFAAIGRRARPSSEATLSSISCCHTRF